MSPDGEPAPGVEPAPRGGTDRSPERVRGGTSYDSAAEIGEGVWSDTLRLTETLYYRVPVDWDSGCRHG